MSKHTPLPSWMEKASREDLLEAAIWYQEDARYLYAWADNHRNLGSDWTAIRVQVNAAHSAALARAAIAKARETE